MVLLKLVKYTVKMEVAGIGKKTARLSLAAPTPSNHRNAKVVSAHRTKMNVSLCTANQKSNRRVSLRPFVKRYKAHWTPSISVVRMEYVDLVYTIQRLKRTKMHV